MEDKEKRFDLEKNSTKDKKGKKILLHSEYDAPGIYEEFRPHWGPGSSYKPWIYGNSMFKNRK